MKRLVAVLVAVLGVLAAVVGAYLVAVEVSFRMLGNRNAKGCESERCWLRRGHRGAHRRRPIDDEPGGGWER